MSLYELKIDFSSPLRLPVRQSSFAACSSSFPAERLFSFIAMGWHRLFGEDSLKRQIIEPSSNGGNPLLLSDLFPCDLNSKLLIPFDYSLAEQQGLLQYLQVNWLSLPEAIETLKSKRTLLDRDSEQLVTDAYNYNRFSMPSSITNAESKGQKPFVSLAMQTRNIAQAEESKIGRQASQQSNKALLRISDPQLLEPLNAVLAFMKEEGLGGMRSYGVGQISSIQLSAVADEIGSETNKAGLYLILSRCYPSKSMLAALEKTPRCSNRYSIGRAAGWIYDEHFQHTGHKKPQAAYFETGSIFSCKPEGRFLDHSVAGHKSFRYGIPFSLAI